MRIDHARPYVIEKLRHAFHPRSVAIVGASNKPDKVGCKVLQKMIDCGYEGEIFPINRRESEIQGLTAYPRLQDIPGGIDLAFVAVPAEHVEQVLVDCVEADVQVVVVATSAFKEVGRGDLQDRLTLYCRKHELPLIGPNLIGMGNPYIDFNCGFTPYLPVKGPIGMISQSGSNLLAALGTSQMDHLGMSFFVGLGNKADVDFAEMIEFAEADENTKCIALYIEGLDSPEAFVESCRKVEKPITVVKVGGSHIGVKAAMAHTASENKGTTDADFDELFDKAGVIRATTWECFLDISMAVGMMPPLKNDHVVMITNGGGSGLLACDHFERCGMPLHELKHISENLPEELKEDMPDFGSRLNPVDISGTATSEMYAGAFEAALTDEQVGGLLVSICPTAVTDVAGTVESLIEIYERHSELNKPFIMECQGGIECRDAIYKLRDHGIPAYPIAERAVNAMIALRKYELVEEEDLKALSFIEHAESSAEADSEKL